MASRSARNVSVAPGGRRRAEQLDEGVGTREPDHLGPLAAVQVADREPVVGAQGDRRRPARPHAERLASRVARHETRDQQAWSARDGHAQALAGSLASASAASAMSCSASSRLAVESSFLTSFSTARRL